jgi:hypothetical protein
LCLPTGGKDVAYGAWVERMKAFHNNLKAGERPGKMENAAMVTFSKPISD